MDGETLALIVGLLSIAAAAGLTALFYRHQLTAEDFTGRD